MLPLLLGILAVSVVNGMGKVAEASAKERENRNLRFRLKFSRLPGDCLVDIQTENIGEHRVTRYTPAFSPWPWQLHAGCDDTGQEHFALQVNSEIEQFTCNIYHTRHRPADLASACSADHRLPKDGFYRNRWVYNHAPSARGGWFVIHINTDGESWRFAHQSCLIPKLAPPKPESLTLDIPAATTEKLEELSQKVEKLGRLSHKIYKHDRMLHKTDEFNRAVPEMIDQAVRYADSTEGFEAQLAAIGNVAKRCEEMRATIAESAMDENYKAQLALVIDQMFDKEVAKFERMVARELEDDDHS